MGKLRTFITPTIAALCLAATAERAEAQATQAENGFRNQFSEQGPPVAPPGPPNATDQQYQSGTAYGGWQNGRIKDASGNVLAGLEGSTFLRPTSADGFQLGAAKLGRTMALQQVSIPLGSIIARPDREPDGSPADPEFYLAEPWNSIGGASDSSDPRLIDGLAVSAGLFHWSPHAGKIFATEPGTVEVVWRLRDLPEPEDSDHPSNFHITTVSVSGSPAQKTRRMFWTEDGFNGPLVDVPVARVGEVNVVYTSQFPSEVPEGQDYRSLNNPPVDPDNTTPAERRTLWHDELDGMIHAYNVEGRVFVELLGDLREPERVHREHLGFEIVDVIKEVRPEELRIAIGDPALPVNVENLTDAESALVPAVIAGDDYLEDHLSLGGTKRTLYAIKETQPLLIVDRNGDGVIERPADEQQSNEVLIYWKEVSLMQLEWPRRYVGYIFKWPDEYLENPTENDLRALYSIYARPEIANDSASLGVQLPTANNPALVYQDDPTLQHAHINEQHVFYTTPGTGNRSLIRYTDGEQIWFERVYSIENSNFDNYTDTASATIGHRIEPPEGADDLVGYIRWADATVGTAFNVNAYIDPFVAGFDAAAEGTIIPINALAGNDVLEVWWYQKNQAPAGTTFATTHWPSLVKRYQLAWPQTDPDDENLYDEIVMARNDGSGELGLASTGSIYRQADPNLPGYNPNEEHALMSRGVAWALRDDLNTSSTSEPFVLIEYTAEDGRPAMLTRRVVRENATHTFDYAAPVGVVLQSPMPLPFMPLPIQEDGAVKNVEVGDPADLPTLADGAAEDDRYALYSRFTHIDRKGQTWIYRGAHGGVNVGDPSDPASITDPSKSFDMHYFYNLRDDFDVPGESYDPGTIVPYLTGAPIDGSLQDADPLEITFTPVWPSEVPVLNVGETLGLPKRGLPAVRGQLSAALVYEQSIAQDLSDDPARSAVLFDPTRAKVAPLAEIPPSVETSDYLGKTYFPQLPPHLSRRLFWDANVGAQGSLVFVGEFVDAVFGEDYYLLNVASASDVEHMKALTGNADDALIWDSAIDALGTTLETFVESTAVPGTYVPDVAQNVAVSAPQFAEILDDDTAVDSYAISAAGGGTGYVVMVANDGEAFVPEGAPVSMEVFKVEAPLYSGELKVVESANPLDEKLTLRHSADFNGDPANYEFEWVTAQPVGGFPPENTGSASWSPVDQTSPLHTIEGASIFTLTDNYFAMRYRALPGTDAHTATGGEWSPWTNPQLAEGWIKRALAGINPFEQRVTDLFSNSVNTDVSLVAQAGKRWEGNIALNLENIDDFGLIEIYETILNRGKDLSISGAPPLNVPAANDALLLAAGYLNDLYMLVGNEAYADAANPTIAFSSDSGLFGTSAQFGELNTSLFAFKGQLASVLDEELALLRGRDDSLQPGVTVNPVYNRLVWNFTNGINSGEPVYALNYNIGDYNADGAADATDAAAQYPQGHGDAYGHYLTALKGYYGLFNNAHFAWTPRVEAVSVLGQPVNIDYQDERKFATAAAAVARTAAQTLELTYRQQFEASESTGWEHLEDGVVNDATGTARHWGTDDWAARAGQGALFHWVTANSILPEEDNVNTGIEKVDRTTVPELDELAAQAEAVQSTLDKADARLNPLGLAAGALSFDISPAEIDAGKTHYEQIFDRAVVALRNADFAFDNAKDSTQMLRRQEETLEERRHAIAVEEAAYDRRLVEIYGTPYADDIGPGKTYAQGYEGPDYLHYAYIDLPEQTANAVGQISAELDTSFAVANYGNLSAHVQGTNQVTYSVDANGEVVKPEGWTGRRSNPGRLQTAFSNLIAARTKFEIAIDDQLTLQADLDSTLDLYIAAQHSWIDELGARDFNESELNAALATLVAAAVLKEATDKAVSAIRWKAVAAAESFPEVLGFSNDGTSAARSAVKFAGGAAAAIFAARGVVAEGFIQGADAAVHILEARLENETAEFQWRTEHAQLINELELLLHQFGGKALALDAAAREVDQAQRDLSSLAAEGDRIQSERETFRKRSAAIVQGYRTNDLAFRVFRDEALEKYQTLFDLAARYTYLAARAYDYETGLLDADGSSAAAGFFKSIIGSRALGVLDADGNPQFSASDTGDPGLAGVLAQMQGDWSVAETRLGFNNPDLYRTTFSLRGENFRILPGEDGDVAWRDQLAAARMDDILEDPDVRRYAMQIDSANGQPVPGIVLTFQSTITEGKNFFGQPLAGGDHSFSPTSFATKIRASGIAFDDYVGLDDPSSIAGSIGGAGGNSPPDPGLGFLDPDALSATPYIYLIPTGADAMRSPPLGDTSLVRTWTVDDQAIPLPFNIGNTDFSTDAGFVSSDSLAEDPFQIRKHQAFRAVPTGTVFGAAPGFTNSRLIGRSAWNSSWKIVIPGRTLRADPDTGLDVFIQTVRDIELFLETYSYSGS